MRRRILAAAIILVAAGFTLARFRGDSGRPLSPRGAGYLPRTARVSQVLDGDSVVLSSGVQLRYIGIDAPEKGEPFADEAREWNRRNVEKRRVHLEYDEDTTDRYGRLLAYVRISSGRDTVPVNLEMVRSGLARAYPNYPNSRYRARITAAQREARREKRGIWSNQGSQDPGPFVRSASRFHRKDCEHVEQIRRPHRIVSRDDALDAGLSPCRSCRP